MLEEKDLQAIRAIMQEETDAVRQDLRQETAAMEDRLDAKLAEARQEIMRGVSALMELEFRPQFSLLAEGQQLIREKLEPLDDLEVLDTRVSALEAMVKKINRELTQLKKAK